MHRTRHELEPGVFLDARRAVWFERTRTLAVADLHLGFAWAQRSRGSMLPLNVPDDTVEQLSALAQDYGARELIVLGDIVHKAVPLEPVREQLRALCAGLSSVLSLRLLGGNHDRGLGRLLSECEFTMQVQAEARVGPHLLMHGDAPPTAEPGEHGRIFMGHEHPAIRMGDGVASVKCPCFLVGPRVVVLPAFSSWAAGCNVRQESFLSPIARAAEFSSAMAIMAGKILPISL